MNLKQEDLFSKCTKCNGNGVYSRRQSILGMPPALQGWESGSCDCSKGIILTENGRVLQDFVKELKRAGLM
jgi:hypothetical protein